MTVLTGNEGVSIALIISITSILCTLYTVFSTSRRQKADDEEARKKALEMEHQRQLDIEKNFVKINFKIDEFCDTVKKLIRDTEKNAEIAKQIRESVIKIEDTINVHEKRLDAHEQRISNLERRRN